MKTEGFEICTTCLGAGQNIIFLEVMCDSENTAWEHCEDCDGQGVIVEEEQGA